MVSSMVRRVRLAVVDADSSGYQHLAHTEADCTFFSSGQAALQASRRWQPDVWLVASRLADMTGLDLCRLLRRQPGGVCFLVADRYSAEEELETLQVPNVLFACKPILLDLLVPLVSSPIKQPNAGKADRFSPRRRRQFSPLGFQPLCSEVSP